MIIAKMKHRYIIGIDEVGRGPLAGPVTIGVVCIPVDFDMSFFVGIKDSKKLGVDSRRMWRDRVMACDTAIHSAGTKRQSLSMAWVASSVSPAVIDRIGINASIRRAMSRALSRLSVAPPQCFVLLDGGLRAPKEYIYQKTIIKGDEKEPVIAIASILAKVYRDTAMERYAERYKQYGFEAHKGYGTPEHLKKILKHGMSDMHRRSFLKRIKGNIR